MVLETIGGGAVCAAVGLMTYAVRGKSSSWLAPSVWRGPSETKRIALTFDDGPSESTPEVLTILEAHGIPATFFQCGANVRRLPEVARQVSNGGHEIGNHSDSHKAYCFRSAQFMREELSRAQETIAETTGAAPALHRPPFGVRWFGLRQAQREVGLQGVMWTVIGLDWKLQADAIAHRISRGVCNGAILCLHDGRDLETAPDVRETTGALRRFVPDLLARGFEFETVSNLLCPTI